MVYLLNFYLHSNTTGCISLKLSDLLLICNLVPSSEVMEASKPKQKKRVGCVSKEHSAYCQKNAQCFRYLT
jgi:BarA-like signal transduction histidine kinase